MRLEAQFNAHKKADPAFILFLQGKKLFSVGGKVQIEKARGQIRRIMVGPVHVEVLRKAEVLKTSAHGGTDLLLHGSLAVAGMMGMNVIIRKYHPDVPFCKRP
jgi:hypothetical protein